MSACASIVVASSSCTRYSLVSRSAENERDLAGVHPFAGLVTGVLSSFLGTTYKLTKCY